MKTSKTSTVLFSITLMAILNGCYESDLGGDKTKDCSVIARCEGQPNLDIRLRQVETYYYENALEPDVSYSDLAQFNYDPSTDQWTGGETFRAILSDFEYSFTYALDGKISSSNRLHTDDEFNTAEVNLSYSYNGSAQLIETLSATSFKNSNDVETRTIDETITYSYASGILNNINFDGYDSGNGGVYYSSDLELSYFGSLLTQIEHTNQSNGDPDYVFKTFQYDNDDRLISSKTYGLNSSDILEELESITYDYYIDGPLKTKTSILTATLPQQKIVTRYSWESGACLVNQIFGDRLYPTPEVPNFPCF